MTIDLAGPTLAGAGVRDQRGRVFRDLRISLTDRCNFRCTYCMPREKFGPEHAYLGRSQLLTDDEIVRLANRFVALGAQKIRLTGGEPLLRAGIVGLVSRLADLEVDLALTTNGTLLPRLAAPLARAGCTRVTVSLDALDDAVFGSMSDTRYRVADVLAGITAAADAGLAPVKINTVVQRGVNDGPGLRHLVDLAGHFRGTGHVVRFIEYMDVGGTNGWSRNDVVPSAAVAAAIHARYPIEPVDPAHPGEVASRYRYRDGAGEVGFISSVSAPFCGECSRGRLSADGRLFTCLFAGAGTDLRGPLRAGAGDAELEDLIAGRWRLRTDRYSELRNHGDGASDGARVEMSFIGG
ncbi:MAG: GTP 3',8-cyclase MoaA [Actinomycetota bacterium]|nr:GTP 3',8-cyclase MoaA [Actinomycetota bacterium]